MNSSMIFPFLLITLLCADTFIFGFSYGLDRVKIPLSSLSLISCISGLTLTLSFLSGDRLLTLLPPFLKTCLPFAVLLLLSLYKIYDALPALHRPKGPLTSEALSRKINQKEAQLLSWNEAALLAVTLSIDNISRIEHWHLSPACFSFTVLLRVDPWCCHMGRMALRPPPLQTLFPQSFDYQCTSPARTCFCPAAVKRHNSSCTASGVSERI